MRTLHFRIYRLWPLVLCTFQTNATNSSRAFWQISLFALSKSATASMQFVWCWVHYLDCIVAYSVDNELVKPIKRRCNDATHLSGSTKLFVYMHWHNTHRHTHTPFEVCAAALITMLIGKSISFCLFFFSINCATAAAQRNGVLGVYSSGEVKTHLIAIEFELVCTFSVNTFSFSGKILLPIIAESITSQSDKRIKWPHLGIHRSENTNEEMEGEKHTTNVFSHVIQCKQCTQFDNNSVLEWHKCAREREHSLYG